MSKVDIYIQGQKLDLFADETITVNSSVQNINDISKVFADFSQSFSVPASKNNNKIFAHYWNADITGNFDARTKESAEIYLDNLLFKRGKIRLNKCLLNCDNISSYNIQFQGDVLKIKDELGDDKLNTLDFSDLQHDYNAETIKQGLESSLFDGNVIYPLISVKRRYLYDSTNSFIDEDNLININYNPSDSDSGIRFIDLKPAVKVNKILQAIQDKYNISFVGDIFNRDYFDNLFIWLNKDKGVLKPSITNGSNIIDWNGGDTTYVDLSTNTLNADFNAFEDIFNSYTVSIDINVSTGFENVPYNLIITKNGNEFYRQENINGNINHVFIWSKSQSGSNSSQTEFNFFIESLESFEYSASLETKKRIYIDFPFSFGEQGGTTTASVDVIEGVVDVSYQMPDIKIFDFLVGLIKMFNIALTPNLDNSISWEVLPEWYQQGKVFKDFEKYIDIEKTEIERGKINNEFAFNYEEPKTILANQFLQNNGISYGDLEARLTDDNGELLDGSKLEIKVPFENMIYERFRDLDNNNLVNLQYGYAVDENQEEIVTKPLIFYNVNTFFNSVGYNDEGTTISEVTQINVPNHCLSLEDNTLQSLNFGAELSTYNFGLMEQSLYNVFYKDYVTDMFSKQRRLYKYSAVVPPFISTQINLNDRLIIGNRRYIINNISTELTGNKVKLELLNDIYTLGEILGDQLSLSSNLIEADKQSRTYSVTVYTNKEVSFASVDEGNGIFITINDSSPINGITTISYSVPENNTGSSRIQSIEFTDGTNTVKHYINQLSDIIKFSNNVITFDNTNITFDNNI